MPHDTLLPRNTVVGTLSPIEKDTKLIHMAKTPQQLQQNTATCFNLHAQTSNLNPNAQEFTPQDSFIEPSTSAGPFHAHIDTLHNYSEQVTDTDTMVTDNFTSQNTDTEQAVTIDILVLIKYYNSQQIHIPVQEMVAPENIILTLQSP
jgi:hypothetical protein